MLRLDYTAVSRIEECLATPAGLLDDLLAVFSQQRGERLLLVYNRDPRRAALPAPPDNHCRVTGLSGLVDVDLKVYDGLTAGFSVLQALRPDVMTHGVDFYSLDHLYLRRGLHSLLLENNYRLARSLLDTTTPRPQAARSLLEFYILQLALPELITRRANAPWVAVQPGPDLAAFVAGEAGRWLSVDDDLGALRTPAHNEWLIALDELRWLTDAVQPERPYHFDLRFVMRRARRTSDLAAAAHALAVKFSVEARQKPALWRPAWELMAQSWLMREDAADLVAFFPHPDFERFAREGDALRIYREMPEGASTLPGRLPLAGLVNQPLQPGQISTAFSMIPPDDLPGLTGTRPLAFDFGQALWKAGHAAPLARTLLQLALDAQDNAPVARAFSVQAQTDLVVRGALLAGLGDPWTWQGGRLGLFEEEAYRTLQRILKSAARTAVGVNRYFDQARIEWFSLALSENAVDGVLHRMASQLRSFIHTAPDEPPYTPMLADARQLIEVEETILYHLVSTKPGEQSPAAMEPVSFPGMVDAVRAQAAQLSRPLPPVSWLFTTHLARLVRLRQETHQVQNYELNADIQLRKLDDLQAQVRRLQRVLFAPPHELALLRFICAYELAELQKMLHELRTAARLQINVLTENLLLQQPVDLTVEITNAGRVEARAVELLLNLDSSFDLLENTSIREIASLQPGQSRRVHYTVRAVQQHEALLRFTCQFAGAERQEHNQRLLVRSLDEKPFRKKGNPYKFGRAIQEPADFYGREETISQLLSSLYGSGHANFLLRSPRRMGKTSLLYMLRNAVENESLRRRFNIPLEWDERLNRYHPVMLDLQAFEMNKGADQIQCFFQTLLDAACSALLPECRASFMETFRRRLGEVGIATALLEQLREIFATCPGQRLLILLDEYDEIYGQLGRDLDRPLRHVVQSEQRMTWVIASTQFLFREGKSHGSPWFNILNIMELKELTFDAARRLVEEPSRSEEVQWHPNSIDLLLQETGRHPAFLQLFCGEIIHHLNQLRRNYVPPETIAQLADQIIEERETLHSHFEFYWADATGLGRLILLAADEKERPASRLSLQQWVQTALEARFGARPSTLAPDARGNPVPWWNREFEDGMVSVSQVINALRFDSSARTYSFTVPLFHRWLSRKRREEDLLQKAMDIIQLEMERDGIH